MTPSELHNTMAGDILKRIVKATNSTPEALVIVESLLLGAVMYAARGDHRKAAEYLEQVAQAVTERITTFPEVRS